MFDFDLQPGIKVRALVAMQGRNIVGLNLPVEKGQFGYIDRRGVGTPAVLTWYAFFNGTGVATTEDELNEGLKFELVHDIASPGRGDDAFTMILGSTLYLGGHWPLSISGSASAHINGSSEIASFSLPWGSSGDDELAQRQADLARHVLACVNVCKGLSTRTIEAMGECGLLLANTSPESKRITAGKELDIPDLGTASLVTRRTVFTLAAYLINLDNRSLLSSIKVEKTGDHQWTVLISDAGIAIDVGRDVELHSSRGTVLQPGYRVFTKKRPGPGCFSSSSDTREHTRLETLSQDEAILCVGQLLARDALNFVPNFPAALAPSSR